MFSHYTNTNIAGEECELRQLLLWRRIFIAILVVLLIPLGIISFYNHASADDYAWANYPHHALVESGGNPIAFLKGCLKMIHWNYFSEHGEFTAILLGVLNPLSWDDDWYWVTAYVLIGFLVFSVFCFWRMLAQRGEQKERVLADITACVTSVILIELIPRAIDMFYWYDGAVNYLPYFALLIIQFGMFIRLYRDGRLGRRSMVVFCLLGFLNMGGNYTTLPVNICAMIGWGIGVAILLRKRSGEAAGTHRTFWRSYIVMMVAALAGILLSILAPGNSVRMDEEGGEQLTSVFEIVARTIDYAAAFVRNQMGIMMILLLALLVPMFWKWSQLMIEREEQAGRRSVFTLPAILVVCYAFFLHCAAYAPTIWIYGTEGAMRMEDVRFFYLVFWLTLLEFYFIGKAVLFLRSLGVRLTLENGQNVVAGQVLSRFLVADLAMICIFGMAYYVLPETNREALTSMSATISLLKGEAQQYDREIKAQQAILEDPSTEGQDVEVIAVKAHPRLLYNSGLEMFEDPGFWINREIANYYDKTSVTLIRDDD